MHSDDAFRLRISEKLADSISSPLPSFTRRQLYGPVSLPNKATAVVGMRRSGKTTFLNQQRCDRAERGIPRERLPYLNFEDEQLTGMTALDLGLMVEEYYRRFPAFRGKETVTWCLDEIQVVTGWERFVRRMLDTEKGEMFLSGPSAALLSREIATAMRGRAWEVVIHPFSFEEFLRHSNCPIPAEPEFVTAAERSAVEHAFLEFLSAGGFPELQGHDASTRKRLLSDYVDVAMLRDVAERHKVSNITGLRWLIRHLLGNAGGLFSIEKIYRAFRSQGLSISKDSVHELLGHIEDCFLVRTVWMDARSERQRMVNPRKSYPIDPGLIPLYDRAGRANTGHAIETVVLLELERRHFEVSYVRTGEGYEVDFLARSASGRMELIQVCADLTSSEACNRELRALLAAGQAYPEAAKRLLTLTRDPRPASAPRDVVVQPVYEWLLAKPG